VKRRVVLLDHPIGNLERCQTCGADCCRSFPAVNISWTEYIRLRALGANRLFFSLSGRYKLIIENGCEFLFQDRCSIYEQRPDICRRFLCIDDAQDAKKKGVFLGTSPPRRTK
jgi:Fe-S-cluster containining protein